MTLWQWRQLAAAVGLAACSFAASGQSGAGDAKQSHGPQAREQARERPSAFDDPQTAKAMLTKWLEDMEKRKPVFVEAIRRLDAGEPVEKVRVYVRENSPPLLRMGPMGGGREAETSGASADGVRTPRDPGSGTVSVADREAILEILGVMDPSARERLVKAQQDRPGDADRLFGETRRRLRWLIDMRRTDHQMYDIHLKEIEFEMKSRRLAADIVAEERSAHPDKAKVESLKKDLHKSVEMRQNMHVGAQAMELARVEEKLAKIRAEVLRAGVESQKIVETETDELLRAARDGDRPGQPAKHPAGEDHPKTGIADPAPAPQPGPPPQDG